MSRVVFLGFRRNKLAIITYIQTQTSQFIASKRLDRNRNRSFNKLPLGRTRRRKGSVTRTLAATRLQGPDSALGGGHPPHACPGEKGAATADTRRAGKESWVRNPAATHLPRRTRYSRGFSQCRPPAQCPSGAPARHSLARLLRRVVPILLRN